MSSSKYVSKNYAADYDIIIGNIKEDISFKEKVYLTVNDINHSPNCKNPNCNDKVKFRNTTLGYREYCSNKCIGSYPNMNKRKEQKSLEKFGTKTPAESEVIKQKMINTNNKLYGGNSPMSNKEIQEKSKKILMGNWGVENPNRHKDLTEKRIKSFKKNIDQFKASFKETSLKKYGVEHHWMVKEIHDKGIKTTNKKKLQKEETKIKKRIPSDYKLLEIFKESELHNRTSSRMLCNKGHEFVINNYLLYHRTVKNDTVICTECHPQNNRSVSGLELQLLNFIEESYEGEIITNNRTIIPPHEVDIYLPEIKLVIEFNGLFWHSEINKDKYYHFNKTNEAEKEGIQMLHIWEDDWLLKDDIVKSMLKNKFNNTPNKVFGRKCKIKKVGSKEYREFLDNNHIQGYSNSTYSYGLYYNEKLVSLMTFSKPRNMMGHKSRDNVYELARFCNKTNYNIVGGASKLFKHFIKEHSPKEIYSFSDRSYSNGNLYKILGFEYSHRSKINYHWVLNKERKHRYNFAKHKLVEKGYDPNLSEREIMYEQVGAYRIWNSGQDKWVYHI